MTIRRIHRNNFTATNGVFARLSDGRWFRCLGKNDEEECLIVDTDDVRTGSQVRKYGKAHTLAAEVKS